MKFLILILISVLGLRITVVSQTREQIDLAMDLARGGLEFLEEGEFEDALRQFRYAQRLTPADAELSILIGQTLFRQAKYEEVIIEIIPLVETKGANDRCYQLLGNSFDMLGRTEDAVRIYMKGLERFPLSAVLHMELGILEFADGNDAAACGWWEKGIVANPAAAANYYWAAKGYSATGQPIRTILYAEIYMNLDRSSERTREMSSLLYQTLKNCISVSDSGAIEFGFSDSVAGDYSLLNMKKVKKMSFAEAYTFVWYLSFMDPVDSVEPDVLFEKRERFARIWEELMSRSKSVQLFEWHRYLISQGYFEPYHFWIFYDGNPDEWKTWFDSHKDVYLDFDIWFANHPMPLELSGLHGPALFGVK